MLDMILGRPHKAANILTHTDKLFRVLVYLDVFGWWEGAGAPGENPHREEETKNFMLRSNRERNGMYERMNEQRIYRKHGAQLVKVQRHTANVTS